MREIRGHVTDIDRHLEEALRAKQQLDAERWRPRRHWPHVIAIAVARRHSWRHDGLSPISKRLRISTSTDHRTNATTAHPTITIPILGLASAPSRLSALLRPRAAGLAALTGRSVEPRMGSYVMVREF